MNSLYWLLGGLFILLRPWQAAASTWPANSALQLGAAWPAQGRNQYHMAESPFTVLKDGNNIQAAWTYQTGEALTLYYESYYILRDRYVRSSPVDNNGPVTSSVTIGADGTIYATSNNKFVYAIHQNGTLKWKYEAGGAIQYSAPVIGSNGNLYFGSSDHNVYSLFPNGTLHWTFQTTGAVEASVIIGSDGTIYVGSFDSYFYAIDSEGNLKWSFLTGDLF